MRIKGQVEMAIVVFFVAALIFLPMVYIFGIEPSSEIRKQASDIEPFMKTTQISTMLSEVYMECAAEKSVHNSTYSIFGIQESLGSVEDYREVMETRISDMYARKVSELAAESGCTVSGTPEISTGIESMNSSEVCGITADIGNEGEPITVKCQGQSSSYSQMVGLGTEAEVEDVRVFWLRDIASSIMANESLGDDFYRMERFYEESYGSSPCFEGIDVELGEAGDTGFWINVSYPERRLYTSEGFINQSIRMRHSQD